MARLSFENSVERLRAAGLVARDDTPQIPSRMPRADDEDLVGVRVFRMVVERGDCSGLVMPRSFFGRSEVNAVSFADSDLSESNLCWNDFIDVSFEGADLSRSDMRASLWTRVSFKGADLSGADLRRSFFEACDFSGARMQGVVLTDILEITSALSAAQIAAIAWADEEGPEPDGG
ncbi:MAG TPA: pentapeptide repeat-containing protein [Caulobacterales bacterium]|nr:pentapeptide repeat-containing protein [Caulobacterales bacterium]